MSLLDFLFPKFCVNCRKLGSYLCTDCFVRISFTSQGFCSVCQKAAIVGVTHPVCKKKFTIDGIFSSVVYSGVVKKLIYRFKYPPFLTDLKSLLGELFYEGLIQQELFYKVTRRQSIVIPIPLYSAKQRRRGYNQAMLLATGISERFKLPVWDSLERVKNTKTQIGLSQIERQANIKDAFIVKKDYESKIEHITQVLLVDDVTTSGATLKEAARVLKKHGVQKVWGITLAHGN